MTWETRQFLTENGYAIKSAFPRSQPSTETGQLQFGFITSDITLTASSPGPIWHVIGDLFVQPGATLTIQPGVTMQFERNFDLLNGGDYFSKSEIVVNGRLVAVGNEANPIQFLATSPGASGWGQLKVTSSGSATLYHCQFSDAARALWLASISFEALSSTISNSTGGIYTASGSQLLTGWTIDNVTYPIDAHSTSTSIIDCDIRMPGATSAGTGVNATCRSLLIRDTSISRTGQGYCGTTITAACDTLHIEDSQFRQTTTCSESYWMRCLTPFVRVSRSVVEGVGDRGFYIDYLNESSFDIRFDHCIMVGLSDALRLQGSAHTSPSHLSLTHCTIDSSNRAIWGNLGNSDLQLTIGNSIISGRSTSGYAIQWSGTPWNVDYSDIWNPGAVLGAVLDTGVVAINPLYVNELTHDYHLRSISPCRFLGEGGVELGAYGTTPTSGTPGSRPSAGVLHLLPNYPNPFLGETRLRFTLSSPGEVRVELFDPQGRLV